MGFLFRDARPAPPAPTETAPGARGWASTLPLRHAASRIVGRQALDDADKALLRGDFCVQSASRWREGADAAVRRRIHEPSGRAASAPSSRRLVALRAILLQDVGDAAGRRVLRRRCRAPGRSSAADRDCAARNVLLCEDAHDRVLHGGRRIDRRLRLELRASGGRDSRCRWSGPRRPTYSSSRFIRQRLHLGRRAHDARQVGKRLAVFVADSRCARGRAPDRDGGGDATGCGHQPALGQHLSPLRLRFMGPPVAAAMRHGRRYCRALCGRHHRRL